MPALLQNLGLVCANDHDTGTCSVGCTVKSTAALVKRDRLPLLTALECLSFAGTAEYRAHLAAAASPST